MLLPDAACDGLLAAEMDVPIRMAAVTGRHIRNHGRILTSSLPPPENYDTEDDLTI